VGRCRLTGGNSENLCPLDFVKFLPVQRSGTATFNEWKFRRLREGWGKQENSAASTLAARLALVRKFRELLPPTSKGSRQPGTAARKSENVCPTPAAGEVLWGMRMSIWECRGCHCPRSTRRPRGTPSKFAFIGPRVRARRGRKKFRESLPPLALFREILPLLYRCGVALQFYKIAPPSRSPLYPRPEIGGMNRWATMGLILTHHGSCAPVREDCFAVIV
jgi:hypothetical protein